MYKAIFFDRDGVVNEPLVKKGKQRPPWSKEEVLINKNFVNLKIIIQVISKSSLLLINQITKED